MSKLKIMRENDFSDNWRHRAPTVQYCFSYNFTGNIWSFIKILQREDNRFNHMRIQFYAGLGARTEQPKTVAIQRRIDNLDMRYYDSLLTPLEYLDGLSFVVAKRKK